MSDAVGPETSDSVTWPGVARLVILAIGQTLGVLLVLLALVMVFRPSWIDLLLARRDALPCPTVCATRVQEKLTNACEATSAQSSATP